jgi:hypothetical protein
MPAIMIKCVQSIRNAYQDAMLTVSPKINKRTPSKKIERKNSDNFSSLKINPKLYFSIHATLFKPPKKIHKIQNIQVKHEN